jgi:hypothetical protein
MMEEEDNFLNRLRLSVNRSEAQSLFLLELLDGDFVKLLELEEKIKNNFIGYCPADRETCDSILSMDNGTGWYRITFKIERKL